MKSITFRPLRRIKKTDKITVASYMQWRKVMTADYNKFNLIIDNQYKSFPSDEYVYDHNGNLLFWFTYNPADIPVFDYNSLLDFDEIRKNHKQYGISWQQKSHVNYNGRGLDCSGVPTFSHYTQDYVAGSYSDVEEFEPLTVGTVTKWFGWFLYQLENSYLQIGK